MVICKQEFSRKQIGGYAGYNFSLVVGAQRSMQAVYDLTCSLRLIPARFPGLIWFFASSAQQSVVWISVSWVLGVMCK